VTSYFYENLQLFKHKLIACTLPEYTYEQYKFSVDTSEDLRLAERMLEKMNYCPWDYSIEEKMKLQETLLKQDKNK
jgi:spore coat polysaccharide biosynthesis protein SpsF (cytidylyltransferase family)